MAATRVKVKDLKNKSLRDLSLSEKVFGAETNRTLVFEAVRAYMAAGRRGTHDTKNRGEVAGSGRKPWKQKKTGRARVGSIRSPLWRTGGTVHGPGPRSYAYAFPRRKRAGALRSALSEKLRSDRLVVLDSMEIESHKTGAFLEQVESLGLTGSVLFLAEPVPRNLELAARNLPDCKVCLASGLNIVDVLRHEWVVLTEAAAKRLEEVLAI